MLIHSLIPASRANGPGLRAVVWFQGCTLNCPGCWNHATHPFTGKHVWPDDFGERIIREAGPTVEGVTFSGGEPMQQAYSLLWLIVRLRERRPGWSFGLFTGYTEAELTAGAYEIQEQDVTRATRAHLWARLTRYLDFAVMGRYNRLQPSTAPLCSSSNQTLKLFTTRYALADFGEQITEVTIGPQGLRIITGFPVLGGHTQ